MVFASYVSLKMFLPPVSLWKGFSKGCFIRFLFYLCFFLFNCLQDHLLYKYKLLKLPSCLLLQFCTSTNLLIKRVIQIYQPQLLNKLALSSLRPMVERSIFCVISQAILYEALLHGRQTNHLFMKSDFFQWFCDVYINVDCSQFLNLYSFIL